MLHYQVDLLNGQSTSLNNNCNSPYDENYYTCQYINSLNKFYIKYGNSSGGVFEHTGSLPCEITVSVTNSFLYYLQKQ